MISRLHKYSRIPKLQSQLPAGRVHGLQSAHGVELAQRGLTVVLGELARDERGCAPHERLLEGGGEAVALVDGGLELLERRLDNVVFRAGFAATIPAARQLVAHGHITVNGKRVSIPSYRIQVGDVVRPKDASLQLKAVHASLQSPSLSSPEWLECDKSRVLARVMSLPDKGSVPMPIDIQLVIEHYSKRI